MAKATSEKRVWPIVLGASLGVSLLLATLGILWYARSPHFEELVRQKLVAALEEATGGQVEMQEFHWNLSKLEFEATGLTVRGLEPAQEAPLAHVDKVRVRAHILSVLQAKVDLTYLALDGPRIHLVIQSDGKTNVPEPKVNSGKDTVQQIFDLAIGRAELRDGVLLINDQKLPLDFAANDVRATTTYDRHDQRYDVTLQVGKMSGKYQDYREVPAQAETEFSLWRNSAQVKRLKLQSQKSSLEVSGTIKHFDSPAAEFSYSGTIDLQQAGAIARVSQLRKGTALVEGKGTYSAEKYAATGTATIREFDYVDQGLQLHDAKMSTDFAADNARIQLTKIVARIFGGSVSGDATVNYLAALSNGNAKPRAQQAGRSSTPDGGRKPGTKIEGGQVPAREQGVAHLKLAGVSLAEVSRALSSRRLPLEKIKLVGSAGGTVDLAWKDSISRAIADSSLSFVAPEQTVADQLPLSGTLVGSFDLAQQAFELRPLTLATRNSRLNAFGRIGERRAALNLSLSTSDLNDFEKVLNVIGQSSVPIDLAGQASFEGTLSGSLHAPAIGGRVQLSDFTYLYNPSATQPVQSVAVRNRNVLPDAPAAPSSAEAPTPVKRIHFDSFSGSIEYSSASVALHHAIIKRVDSTVNLDGAATLQDGGFTDQSQFQLQATVQGADVTRLQEIVGTTYPIIGTLNLSLQAFGTKAKPCADASVAVSSGQAYGRRFDSLTSNVTFKNEEVQIRNVKLKAPGATVTGGGAYNINTRQMKADLHGQDIHLAKLPELQLEKLSSAGDATFDAHVSGTPENPVVDARVRVDRLVLNDEHIGDLTLDAVTRDHQLMLTGRSRFEHATLALDGTVQMHSDLPAALNLQFSNLDIDPFLSAGIKGRITAHSGIDGRANISGPLRQPSALAGVFTVDAFHVEVEKIPIKSDGPIEVALANEAVTVKRLVMTSADTRLVVSGNLNLRGERPLDLRADGSINLALLQTFDPDLTSSGTANLNVTVQGTLAKPAMTGRVDIAHLSLSNIDLPAALADVNGSLVFNQDRLEIEKLTGRIGGGIVTFAGYITYADTIGFDITSDGTDIRFRYAGISVTANQSLKLQGTLKNATVSGNITITRFAQIPSSDLAAVFANSPGQVPNATSPLNNLHLDVRVQSAPELTVQTSLAKLSGDADLRVRGTALRPVLLGRINIAQGDIKLNGTKYYLERGDITFANPVRIDPILDIEATTQVRDYDITIGLHGTMERLLTTYRSDPPLSSDDIISLLAFGRTQQEGSTSGGNFSGGFGEAASSAVLGAAINQAVSNRVSRLFGVSSIRINPAAGGGPDNNPNARLTVEQQVSSDVTITYITNLARSAQQVIQFEYNIKRDYTINAIRDENGVLSFDLLIRKRKK